MKKITGVLLTFILLVSMLFPLAGGDSASAATSQGFKVSSPEVVKETVYEDLAVNKNGTTRSLSAKESREFQKLVEKEYFKNQKKTTIYTKKGQSNLNSKGMTAQAKKPVNFLRVEHLTVFDGRKDKGTITMSSKIVEMTGQKPHTIWTGAQLYKGTNQYGKYTEVTKFNTKWQGADIKIGKKTSKTYNNKTTHFYQTYSRTTAGWNGVGTRTSEGATEEVLVNKKTVTYPEIYNSHNRTTMWTPTKANIKVVPVEDRTERDYKLKDKFMTWYIKTYGDPKWGPKWPGADIHHELPLKYGGTNAMSNLFPLPRDLHQKTVTPWWASY
ncbi:HNH endonuclease signature motif containing protein [Peribacillus sp. NPDC096448]|uniref:HNH endonuclease signature motif containing protein n=1 Tax=Peribacillus sp. NPDC096448 TaxID=3364395 RepID=UPI003823F22D